jgi:hypothetical protein
MATQDYNFQDRMASGKDNNHERRQRGLPAGTNAKGWQFERSYGGHDEWFAKWRTRWISDCYEIQRTFLKTAEGV